MPRRRLLWFLIPFLIVFGTLAAVRGNREMAKNELGSVLPGTALVGRVVFVMVDSLTASLAEDARQFPALSRLRPRAAWGRIAGCLPASTVACTRTMLEGSSAGYVASLDNFAARRAGAESFPMLAHAHGLRVALVSDHTFTHMLGDLGGPRLAYVEAGVPVYGWDEAALSHVRQWLRSDAADVVMVHLVDLDKASHVPGPGTPRYAEEVRGADAAIAGIAAELAPGDTLIVAGDHGHDEFGNHTPDPGYLAIGPAFAPGRQDIEQATIALFFSASAATPLPPTYDGEIPEGALARPYGGSRERETTIRAAVTAGREARRSSLRRQTLEFMPGLALAALSLGALFPLSRRRQAMLAMLVAAAVSVALGFGWARVFRAAFWLGPPANFLNYLALFAAVFAAATFAARRSFAVAWPVAAGAGLLVFPLFVHLMGDDYFASVRTLSRVLPIAIVLFSLDALRARERSAWIAVAAALASFALGELHGAALDASAASALFALLAASLLYAGSRGNPRWMRLALSALPLALSLGMRHAGWASLVLALSALSVSAIAADRRLPAALRGLLLAAAVIATYWVGLGSLRFDRIRFEFALAWLPTVPNEALLALLVTPLALIKYALVVFVPLSLVRFDELELRDATAFFVSVPSLSATAFVAGASCAGGSRYHETAIQEAALYAAIALLTLLVLACKSRGVVPALRAEVAPAFAAGK